ncbi:PNPLA2 [Branchiostoma lanceolatum]|uniref:triacylglycerol lipase n=1 Tax=Branchiostoma lanceolatum TaxID=7740 RepID=A0A8K0EMC0_BRALA|nr:PNPLA2 [Branchiostoma lanceolatum]
MNISFSGCGFLGMYHVGVASCIMQHAPNLQLQKLGGASAGAMSAAMLLFGCDLRECTDSVLRLATQARKRRLGPMHPSFRLVKTLREGMRRIFPPNAHEIASGRLCLSVTRVCDGQNIILDQFDTREELIQALICSAFVPVYCGLVPPMFKGTRYVDGGLSNNCPHLGKNTITVSPFSGEADICPMDKLSNNLLNFSMTNTSIQFTTTNMWRMAIAFFPPDPEVLQEICRQGFNDALRFLRENDLIGCMRHVSSVRSMSEAFNYDTARSTSECSDDVFVEIGIEETAAEEKEECSECKSEIHHANKQTLPAQVLDVFQEANRKGILQSILNSYTASFVSLVTLPYILPFETAFNYTLRFAEWAPEETAYYLRKLLKHLESQMGRHASQLKDRVVELGAKSTYSQQLKDCRLVALLQKLLDELERRGVISRRGLLNTTDSAPLGNNMAESSPLSLECPDDIVVRSDKPTFRHRPHFYLELDDTLDYSEPWSGTADLDSLMGYVETQDYILHRLDWIDAVVASHYSKMIDSDREDCEELEASMSEDEGIASLTDSTEVSFSSKL